MARKSLIKPRPESLDIRDRRNYPTYLAGIAAEISAVLALTAIAFAVALLGFFLWR